MVASQVLPSSSANEVPAKEIRLFNTNRLAKTFQANLTDDDDADNKPTITLFISNPITRFQPCI